MILVVDCFKLVRGAGKSIGIYNLALNLVRNLVEEKAGTKDSEIKQCQTASVVPEIGIVA